jgi:hypothetical protein
MQTNQASSWWSRNWKWFVPAGCLSCLVIGCGGAAAIVALVFGTMKSSDAYQQAVAAARTSPAVEKALGTPLEEGYFTTGSIQVSGPAGNAQLAIPITGPKAQGTLYVEALKSAGQWRFSTFVLEVEPTRQRINLLEDLKE